MYKPREILYILYGRNLILAISDNEKNIYQYYLQFKSYFDEKYSEISITPVVSKSKISEIMVKYSDTYWLQWLTDEIVLTSREYDYYIQDLRKIYEDTKNMMSQLLILNKFTNFSPEDKKKLIDTFDFTYNNIQSFNEFISNINSKEFFDTYIEVPEITERYIELNSLMRMNIENDK